MDLQKTITGGTAAIAVGTASMVGGGAVVDKVNDGPAKRQTAVVKATKEELKEYIEQHTPEERRLLWLGVMYGGNYLAHQVNETFDLKYKDKK